MKKFLLVGSTIFSAFLFLKILKSKKFLYKCIILTTTDIICVNNITIMYSAVKKLALLYNVSLHQLSCFSIFYKFYLEKFIYISCSIIIAYPKKIPRFLFLSKKIQYYNIHPSLLPFYRGPSPITTAVLDDLSVTGVTIHRITGCFDMGPICLNKIVLLCLEDSIFIIEKKLLYLLYICFIKFIILFKKRKLFFKKTRNVTITKKTNFILKAHVKINWFNNVNSILTHIRAYQLNKVAYTVFKGKRLDVLKATRFELNEFLFLKKDIGFLFVYNNVNLIVKVNDGFIKLDKIRLASKVAVVVDYNFCKFSKLFR